MADLSRINNGMLNLEEKIANSLKFLATIDITYELADATKKQTAYSEFDLSL